jgi:hypothetical protein
VSLSPEVFGGKAFKSQQRHVGIHTSGSVQYHKSKTNCVFDVALAEFVRFDGSRRSKLFGVHDTPCFLKQTSFLLGIRWVFLLGGGYSRRYFRVPLVLKWRRTTRAVVLSTSYFKSY